MQDADAACVKLSHHIGIELTSQRGSSKSCPTSHMYRPHWSSRTRTLEETMKCESLKLVNCWESAQE